MEIRTAAAVAAGLLALASPVRAEKLTIPYSPLPGLLGAYVAQEEGYFTRRNLDVELVFTAANGAAVAAIAGGTTRIGTVTPTALLQAAANGIELVAICGADVWPLPTNSGLLVKTDAKIDVPKDLAGRKVAVPGLNGTMDLLLRRWLKANAVADTTIVEVGIALTGNAVRQGTVDAGAVTDPFYSRAMAGGGLKSLGDFFQAPAGTQAIVFAGSKDWVSGNHAVVKAFQDAVAEGAKFAKDPANEARARAILAKYTRLPDAVIATLPLPNLEPALRKTSLDFWITSMLAERWLDKPLDGPSFVDATAP